MRPQKNFKTWEEVPFLDLMAGLKPFLEALDDKAEIVLKRMKTDQVYLKKISDFRQKEIDVKND